MSARSPAAPSASSGVPRRSVEMALAWISAPDMTRPPPAAVACRSPCLRADVPTTTILSSKRRGSAPSQHVREGEVRERARGPVVVDPCALEALGGVAGQAGGDDREALQPAGARLGPIGAGQADRLVHLAVGAVRRDREPGVPDARRQLLGGTAQDLALALAVDPGGGEQELRAGALDRRPERRVLGGPLEELDVVGDHRRTGRPQGVDHAGVEPSRDPVAAASERRQARVVEVDDDDVAVDRDVAAEREPGVERPQLGLLEPRRLEDVGDEHEHDRRGGRGRHAEGGRAALEPRRMEARLPVEQRLREDVVEDLVGRRVVDGPQDAGVAAGQLLERSRDVVLPHAGEPGQVRPALGDLRAGRRDQVVERARHPPALRRRELGHRLAEVLADDLAQAAHRAQRRDAQLGRAALPLALPQPSHDELEVGRLDALPAAEPEAAGGAGAGLALVQQREDVLGQAGLERRLAAGDRLGDRLDGGGVGHRPEPHEVAELRRRRPLEQVEARERVLAQGDEHARAEVGARDGGEQLVPEAVVLPGVVEEVLLELVEDEQQDPAGLLAAARQRVVERARRRRRAERRPGRRSRRGSLAPGRPARRRRARSPAGCRREGPRRRRARAAAPLRGAASSCPCRSVRRAPSGAR